MPNFEKNTAQVRYYSDVSKRHIAENFHDLKQDITSAEVKELASIVAMYAPATHLIQSVALTRRDRFTFY